VAWTTGATVGTEKGKSAAGFARPVRRAFRHFCRGRVRVNRDTKRRVAAAVGAPGRAWAAVRRARRRWRSLRDAGLGAIVPGQSQQGASDRSVGYRACEGVTVGVTPAAVRAAVAAAATVAATPADDPDGRPTDLSGRSVDRHLTEVPTSAIVDLRPICRVADASRRTVAISIRRVHGVIERSPGGNLRHRLPSDAGVGAPRRERDRRRSVRARRIASRRRIRQNCRTETREGVTLRVRIEARCGRPRRGPCSRTQRLAAPAPWAPPLQPIRAAPAGAITRSPFP
jgi:hypothetical protein